MRHLDGRASSPRWRSSARRCGHRRLRAGWHSSGICRTVPYSGIYRTADRVGESANRSHAWHDESGDDESEHEQSGHNESQRKSEWTESQWDQWDSERPESQWDAQRNQSEWDQPEHDESEYNESEYNKSKYAAADQSAARESSVWTRVLRKLSPSCFGGLARARLFYER
jgi:hypothetical protein